MPPCGNWPEAALSVESWMQPTIAVDVGAWAGKDVVWASSVGQQHSKDLAWEVEWGEIEPRWLSWRKQQTGADDTVAPASKFLQEKSERMPDIDEPEHPSDLLVGELPSIGSKDHSTGECKRCAFFPKGRCLNGKDCSHCHYPHEERRTRKRKAGRKEKIIDQETSEDEIPEATPLLMPSGALCDESIAFGSLEVVSAEEEAYLLEKEARRLEAEAAELESQAMLRAQQAKKVLSIEETGEIKTKRAAHIEHLKSSATYRLEADGDDHWPKASLSEDETTASSAACDIAALSSEGETSPQSTDIETLQKDSKTKQQDKVVRTARSILNKVTAGCFEGLCEELCGCGFESETQFQLLVAEVFKVATNQHQLVDVYADLCVHLDLYFQKNIVHGCSGNNFRKALVSECQRSFECFLNEPKSDESLGSEALNEEHAKFKTRVVANMRFIGELLVRKLIAGKILIAVSEELLRIGNAAAVEAAVNLLQVAGPTFDRKTFAYQPRLGALFESLRLLSKDSALPQSTRNFMEDLLNLRKSNWTCPQV